MASMTPGDMNNSPRAPAPNTPFAPNSPASSLPMSGGLVGSPMVSSNCSSPMVMRPSGTGSTNNVVGVSPNRPDQSPMGPMQEKTPGPRQSPAIPESSPMMHGPDMSPMPVSNMPPSSMPPSSPMMSLNVTSPMMIQPSGPSPVMTGQPRPRGPIPQQPMMGPQPGGNPMMNPMMGNQQPNIQGN